MDTLESLWSRSREAASKGDFAGSLFLLRSLAEKGEWSACARIAELYETGAPGVDQDFQEAARWYRRGVFEVDDPSAHLGLGRLTFNGWGTEKNEITAKAHLEKAFVSGEIEAGVYLGLIFLRLRDHQRAKYYFDAAAKVGYCYPHVALARIAVREFKFLEALHQIKKTLVTTIEVYRKNPSDRRLIGIVTNVRWSRA